MFSHGLQFFLVLMLKLVHLGPMGNFPFKTTTKFAYIQCPSCRFNMCLHYKLSVTKLISICMASHTTL